MRSGRIAGWALGALLVLLASCSRRHLVDPPRDSAYDPGAPGATSDPGQPTALSAWIASGQVTLRWMIADPSRVLYYRVYQRLDSETDFHMVDTAAARVETVTGLQDGVTYVFEVAAVNASGLEGRPSAPLAVRISPFNVTINAGALFTNNLNVSLSLSAPGGVTRTVISNTPDFADSAVFDFATTRSWTLASGPDGARSVYVRFLDAGGNVALAADGIAVDRLAEITSVTENSGGSTLKPGDVVTFTLTSGEANGTATVDVGTAKTGIRLFDDGTHGDAVASDGTYTLNYTIELGVEATSAPVTGRFTDLAGNSATRAAATLLTIQSPPPAVSLTGVVPVSTSAINVFWSQSGIADFASYRLWRAETRTVLAAPTRAVVTSPSSRSTTSFQDNGLKEDLRYYYVVEVLDQSGLATASNVDSATTLNDFPTPVVLDSVSTVGTDRVLLTWSRNQNTDFAAYRIFQSTAPGADTTRTLAATVTNQATLYRDVTGLAPSTTYYYRVYVVDRSGRQVPSNEVKARTLP